MKRKCIMPLCLLLLMGCTSQESKEQQNDTNTFQQITAEKANDMIENHEQDVILDVRTKEEYATGHIEGAILLPDNEVSAKAQDMIPDKTATILVYCRTGNRSKQAAKTLVTMGYTNVYEMGGIMDWSYGIVK